MGYPRGYTALLNSFSHQQRVSVAVHVPALAVCLSAMLSHLPRQPEPAWSRPWEHLSTALSLQHPLAHSPLLEQDAQRYVDGLEKDLRVHPRAEVILEETEKEQCSQRFRLMICFEWLSMNYLDIVLRHMPARTVRMFPRPAVCALPSFTAGPGTTGSPLSRTFQIPSVVSGSKIPRLLLESLAASFSRLVSALISLCFVKTWRL
ncbi:unnamed protein product [Symbiodinium necroappetens]|uniref:Uncharacterized protein n=1 Tax=Symbiodinium necroappetens TaxID=1628268 RepID=A0A812TVF0_9DINO|nr:unnamed protein product [Symbiodinium necroappetens]